MGFVKMPLGDYVEKEPVPEGEYEVVIESVDLIEQGGKERLSVRLSIDGHPDAKAVFHNINLTLSDDPAKANTQLGFTRAFLDLFDIPWKEGGFDPDEIEPGMRATCNLTVGEYEGVLSNNIKLRI